MKELKDYLHLYLKVFDRILLFEKSNYYFVHNLFIHKGDTRVLDARILSEIQTHGEGLQYKLLLRPMSKLTKQELINEGFNSHIDFLTHENMPPIKAPFEMTIHCINKGFDVFGLIESGLAIDSTLPPSNK